MKWNKTFAENQQTQNVYGECQQYRKQTLTYFNELWSVPIRFTNLIWCDRGLRCDVTITDLWRMLSDRSRRFASSSCFSLVDSWSTRPWRRSSSRWVLRHQSRSSSRSSSIVPVPIWFQGNPSHSTPHPTTNMPIIDLKCSSSSLTCQ